MGDAEIGGDAPVFVIAEVGASHGGDVNVAVRLVEEAASAGVDAVKLQVVAPDESYAPGSPSHEIFSRLWLERRDVERLVEVAANAGVTLFSTPGSRPDLDLIVETGMPLIKISSGLLSNSPLIEDAARTGLPILLSTGMSYLDEVHAAIAVAEGAGATDLAVLHCTSLYPAPASSLNLRAMATLAEAIPYPTGFSDHYDGIESCLAAVALGARLLEKHFTLDRSGGGPDDHFSCDPPQLRALVTAVRQVEAMLGEPQKAPVEAELEGRVRLRRMLVARDRIHPGEVLDRYNVAMKRLATPGEGLGSDEFAKVLGSRATRTIERDECIRLDALDV